MKRCFGSFPLAALAIYICIFIPACGKPDVKTSNSVSTTTIKDGDYEGRGKVTKIDMSLGSVEMDHEEIKGLMPAMRMEFFVSDKAMLGPLTVGDSVDFTIRYKAGTETITKIEKSK